MALEGVQKNVTPGPGDVHINKPLTNISVAYIQDTTNFIADRVFPRIGVQKQSDLYFKYDKGDWFRNEAQKRAPATESPGGRYNLSTDTYFCHIYAFHKTIDAQTRTNEDTPLDGDADAAEFVTQRLLLRREIDFMDAYFKAGVWDHEYDGETSDFTQFSDETEDPVPFFDEVKDDIYEESGFMPNTLVLSHKAWRALKKNEKLLERIKYTQRGVMPLDLLGSLLEIPRVYVARAIKNDAQEGASDDFSYVGDTDDFAWLGYVPERPGLRRPSAGYTFVWTGYGGQNAYGVTISKWYNNDIKADKIEGELCYDQKIVASDLGAFMHDFVG